MPENMNHNTKFTKKPVMKTAALLLPLLALVFFACKQDPPAHKYKPGRPEKKPVTYSSLTGAAFYEPDRPQPLQALLDTNLMQARRQFEQNPSEENYIWLGRRLGYLSHFEDAVKVFSEGLEKYPQSYRLYRHRGHRFISLRKYDEAIADLEKAAARMEGKPLEIEPDGQPNKQNIPLSTTQFNVWYHMGLAHYLKGDYPRAKAVYERRCLQVSNNDDLLCASVDWLYMTYRRMGRPDEAEKLLNRIGTNMNILENVDYYKRLRMYKGDFPPDALLAVDTTTQDPDLSLATQGYGVGNWYLYRGDTARAVQIFKQVTAGKHFSAFGFIAAEAELKRLK
jgi:tetratricopeptide (TPR) repeat protein